MGKNKRKKHKKVVMEVDDAVELVEAVETEQPSQFAYPDGIVPESALQDWSKSIRVDKTNPDLGYEFLLVRYLRRLAGEHVLSEEFFAFLEEAMPLRVQQELMRVLADRFLGDWEAKELVGCVTEHGFRMMFAVFNEKRGWNTASQDLKTGILQVTDAITRTATWQSWDEPEKLPMFAELIRVFELDALDCQILLVGWVYRECKAFERLLDSPNSWDQVDQLAMLCGCQKADLVDRMAEEGKLFRKGLVETNFCYLFLLEAVTYHHLATKGKDALVGQYTREDEGPVHPLDSFGLETIELHLLETLARSTDPAHILFYGKPGVGKTELARSLVRGSGRVCRLFTLPVEESVTKQFSTLMMAASTVDPFQSILVVDEADRLLCSSDSSGEVRTGIDKSLVNQFLDSCKATVIWITNRISGIESSVVRRFAYSRQFGDLSPGQRERIWRLALEKHPTSAQRIQPKEIPVLARRYALNTGSISRSLEVLDTCLGDASTTPGGASVMPLLEQLLDSHQRLQHGGEPAKPHRVSEAYDPALLNTEPGINQVMAMARQVTGKAADTAPDAHTGLRLLFWGLPGTGKTAFARYLAEALDRPLVSKRASELISPLVGMTEAAIREAFEEASRENAILFIDEADSYFRKREQARNSWEVTQVNEFLTGIDAFDGILICCTNLLATLDPALIRRFNRKVEFKPLVTERAVDLVSRRFPELGNAGIDQVRRQLSRLDGITPGDIDTVWQGLRFETEHTSGSLAELIVAALEVECRYRATVSPESRIIGFGAA
jgi:SpoVK/Ycf46/Vps4 family AAA+-type ATPase